MKDQTTFFKTKKMKRTGLFVLAGLLTLSVASCKKAKENRDTTTSKDLAIAEGGYGDMRTVADHVSDGGTLESFYGNPTVTVSPAWPDTTFPKTITVDFGTGCTDITGKTRKGILTTVITGWFRTPGTVVTTTPTDYSVNDYAIDGIRTVTNDGYNADGNLEYTVTITSGQITYPGGEVMTWESTRVREWLEGESTSYLTSGYSGVTDDVWSITGTASGVNSKGRNFTANITSPLIVRADCRWITQGSFEINPEGLDTRAIDYGEGTCDGDAVVSIGEKTYNITIPY